MMPRINPRAFTLIELLIVVAIIAILAAIAVTNFLEAQTRSKVSRVKADQRSIATAFEAYAVDNNNQYPAYGHPFDYAAAAGKVVTHVPARLTTPTAYMTQLPADTFPHAADLVPSPQAAPFYYMHNYGVEYLGKHFHADHIPEHYSAITGGGFRAVEWTIWSYGPDNADNHGTTLYDPTNGTLSAGDMVHWGP